MKGCLLISLDFELMWGMFDVVSKSEYGKSHVENVPLAIDRMIELFNKYNVHVTVATVGMIMYNNKSHLLSDVPSKKPSYDNPKCSAYNGIIESIKNNEEKQFFQPDVIEKLKNSAGVEIGTHTFCHYYCWEKGQTVEEFEADIKKACEVAKNKDIVVRSIVFPRNQVSEEHLKICAKYGISSYRGNATRYFDEPKSKIEGYKNRLFRFIDSYINIGGMTDTLLDEINLNESPINLRASRFLKPYSPRLAFLDGFRIRRMKKEMLHAAQNGEMYHLWWHPHNFGAYMDENLLFLEELLKYYKQCNAKFGMNSFTMSEMVEYLKNNEL